MKVLPLSDNINFGNPLPPMDFFKHQKNDVTDKSLINSKCIIFSLTLKSGNGTVDSDPYDAPSNLLHVIHVPIIFLTASDVLLSNIDFFIH